MGKGKANPLEALRVPGGRGSQISRQSEHKGDKVFSPMNRQPWYSFLLEAEWTQGQGAAGRIVNKKFQ